MVTRVAALVQPQTRYSGSRSSMTAHPDNIFLEALLAEDSLCQYLAPMGNLCFDIVFPIREVTF